MTQESINDYLTNIKTFQVYLEHIVNSVESQRYHVDTIKKLSHLISSYYSEVNQEDDEEDDIEVVDTICYDDVEVVEAEGYDSADEHVSLSPQYGSDSDTSVDSKISLKSEDKKSVKSEEKRVKNSCRYFNEFSEESIDNEQLLLYKKYPRLINISNEMLNNKY